MIKASRKPQSIRLPNAHTNRGKFTSQSIQNIVAAVAVAVHSYDRDLKFSVETCEMLKWFI